MTLIEAATNIKTFCLVFNKENQLELKKNHDYYYQVQCTMFCAQRPWYDFVVMAKTLHIQRITYDPGFWFNLHVSWNTSSFYSSSMVSSDI